MSKPFTTLGLSDDATAAEVRAARRELAKLHHPDAGGDAELMRMINTAAGAALLAIATRSDSPLTNATPTRTPTRTGGERDDVTRDVPSFTVEALPVETFEALLVVTGWIGEVLDDDPPYRLEAHLYQPTQCWCRLELVPDAGASTVSITLASYAEQPIPPIEAVRDLWVQQLNQYRWD